MEVLREFSVTNLKHSAEGKKLSSGASYRPVEAQYQDEFYRAFSSVVGRGVPICTEWSRTSDGRVDFGYRRRSGQSNFSESMTELINISRDFRREGVTIPRWQNV